MRFLQLVASLSLAAALYGPSSDVEILTAKTFHEKVTNSEDLWLVEFFADWCGHCQQFAPEYEKAAKALKGIVRVGAFSDEAAMGQFGIKGFPTVKFYGEDKRAPLDYNQQRTASAVVDYALQRVGAIAKSRLSGGGKGSGGASDVIVLTDSSFDKTVMSDENSVWLVEFYAPWCGHCKSLEPLWEKTASELKGKVKVAKIDATQETVLAKRFTIQGFPSIKLFPAGHKADDLAVNYEEERSVSAMVKFGLKYHSMTVEAAQLVQHSQFEEECSHRVCVVTFLPHILDSGADGRKKYLEDFNLAIRASAGLPVSYFWSQGGEQFDVEESLRLQFGFPALVAIHKDKGKYAVHRGSFGQESIREFLTGLMSGRAALDILPKNLPHFSKVEPWDGKDMVLEEEPLYEEL